MVQIHGSGASNFLHTAMVTAEQELLVTGSLNTLNPTGDTRDLAQERILIEILNEMKIMNEQMRFITNENIREVEII